MTTISTLPAAPNPLTDSQSSFNAKALAFTQALGPFVTETNTVASEVMTAKANAETAETNAEAAQAAAEAQVALAAAQVALAAGHATSADASADAAAASAASALSAPGTNATSSTSLTLGTGAKSLTIQTGKSIVVGTSVIIAYTTTPTSRMSGVVTAYNSGTGALDVTVDVVVGTGTYANWTISLGMVQVPLPPQIGDGGTTAAGDVTLTDASPAVQVVTPSALGQSITLPDATTCDLGAPLFYVSNKGAFDYGVRDASGALVSVIEAGGCATMGLAENSTAAGNWAIGGTGLRPGMVTCDTTFSTTYTNVYNHYAALTASLSVHFLNRATTGFSAVAVDSAGKTIGTPVQVDSGTNCQVHAVFRIDDTHAVVFWGQNSNYRAAVLTFTGTSISVGTVASTTTSWALGSYDTGVGLVKFLQLSASLYLVTNCDGGTLRSTAISVSGTTCTIGAAVDTSKTLTSNSAHSIALTGTSAIVFYRDTAGPYQYARIVSVSGTTCTHGAELTISIASTTALAVTLLTSTKLVVAGNGNASAVKCVALTVSGSTVSAGAYLTIESGLSGATAQFDLKGEESRNAQSMIRLSDTTALLVYFCTDGSTIRYSRAVVLTESSGTMSAGNILTNGFRNGTSNGTGDGYALPLSADGFVAQITQYSISNTQAAWRLVAHTISGTNVVNGLGDVLIDGTALYSGVRLDSGVYIGASESSTVACPTISVFRQTSGVVEWCGVVKITQFYGATGPDGWSYPRLEKGTVLFGLAGGQNGGSSVTRLAFVEVVQ